ncbi:MAG TPA: TRZ/ATZ family hydrolase, partial [Povalibacter sp.]
FMEHVDTLITARWVIPIEPHGHVLDHHCVAVRQGRIVAIEPREQALRRFTADQVIDRPTHVLLPGLVNAHTHAAMSLLRGAAESSSLGHWLTVQIWPLEKRWIDAEYVRDGTELAIAEMLSSGTTCFADMHLFPEVVAQTASAARIRACVGLPVLDAASPWADSVSAYIEKGLRLHDEYRDDPLITTAFAPYTPAVVSDETLSRLRRTADELDELPVIMQINESRTDAVTEGERTLARLERLGVLSPLLSAVHMVHADDEDLDRAAAAGISITHCPQSNLKLGNGVCPIAAIRSRGINVALGTNSAASNNDLNMLDEMRTAALLVSGIAARRPERFTPMNAHDWLHAATLGGARALGLTDAIGSLVPGKWADLCCIDLARPQSQPVYDPAVHIVYSVSSDQVSDVWVAGRPLVTAGKHTHMDLADILRRAQDWQARIAPTRQG